MIYAPDSEAKLAATTVATSSEKLITSSERFVQHGEYKIVESPSEVFSFERQPSSFRWANIVGWALWYCYLAIELFYIRSSSSGFGLTRICLLTGFVAELALFFVDANWAMDAIFSISKPHTQPRRPYYRLVGDHVPFVDVFVTCCGEPLDVLLNTITAAASLDYPTSKYRVTVLDDGHDPKLHEAVNSLNRGREDLAPVYYLSRDGNSFFKAGNLNYGIQETKKSTDGEFLASLDADMIVSTDWLRNLVPHLLLDPKVGLATSPQNYYTTPAGDPLAQQTEFTMWNTVFEPIHDLVGEAMCMGTGFVVRRSALESIDGWPLAATGEDYMCSTKLVEKGWKIALIRENHQHGITPGSFQSRIKQRLRWVDAAFEVHGANNWYMTNDFGDGVKLVDKAASMIFALRDLSAVSTLLSLVVLLAAVFALASSENVPVVPPSPGLYKLLNTMLVAAFTTGKVCEWVIYRHVGLTHSSNLQALDVWASPYCATRCFSHFLQAASVATPTFFITGSFNCPTNERNQQKRAPLLTRLTSFGIPFHTIYIILSTSVIAYSLGFFSFSWDSSSTTVSSVLPGHVLLLARCTWKVAVPVLYMVWPPSVPEWKQFLAPDSKGVLRPKKPYPVRARPEEEGEVLEMGRAWVWRYAWEVAVLAVALGFGARR